MIPLHKYSYPYLGQLEFSSWGFILLVGVTRLLVKVTCGKFNWMGMIWKGTHLFIKGPTADNAYQNKNQALGSKEHSVELRNRFASSHTSGEEFRKKFCFIEGSQKYLVSVTLKGRNLKQPGFFLELASWPNWWIRALVRVVTKNLMVILIELHDHMCRQEKPTEGQTPLHHSTDLAFMTVWPNSILSSVKTTTKKKLLNDP